MGHLKERNAVSSSMKIPKTGRLGGRVLMSVWSLGLAACLTHWLSGYRPRLLAGLMMFFVQCCSGWSSLRLLAYCYKIVLLQNAVLIFFFSNSVLSNMEIISTTFLSYSILALESEHKKRKTGEFGFISCSVTHVELRTS